MPVVYLYLAISTYYFIHSVLASDKAKQLLSPSLIPAPYYRIFYNIASSLLLLPLLYLYFQTDKYLVFESNLWTTILGFGLLGFGGVFNLRAIRQYNLSEFSGTLYLKGEEHTLPKELNTSGLNAYVRHPLYLAALMVFWGLFLTKPNTGTFAFASVTSFYLFIGIYLEEQKLIKAFGSAYIDYKKQVPMLLPNFLKSLK